MPIKMIDRSPRWPTLPCMFAFSWEANVEYLYNQANQPIWQRKIDTSGAPVPRSMSPMQTDALTASFDGVGWFYTEDTPDEERRESAERRWACFTAASMFGNSSSNGAGSSKHPTIGF